MSGTKTLVVERDLHGHTTGLSQPVVLLKVVRGPDRRRQQRFEAPRFTVGATASDFQLTDPTVSALHCELRWEEDGLRVRDLGSKNGLRLEGRRVIEGFVESGDRLRLGETELKVMLLDEANHVPLAPRSRFGGLVGSSIPMRRLYDALARLTRSDATVLLQGETGVGKELAALALIEAGPRRDQPMVFVDCGALGVNLAESELFGHEKGAFTGADRAVPGAFERAHQGTLILDAVSDLAMELQPKLLGVLERRQVSRLGARQPIPLDVRVVATSQAELEPLVNRGRFRADLFFRLAGVQLRLPALREHPEDIPELVAHFLESRGGPAIPAAELRRLCEAEYPGNVRQLQAAIEHAVLGLEAAPARAPDPMRPDLERPLLSQRDALAADFERRYLEAQIEACGGNISKAARKAGVDRMYLHRLAQRYGLSRARLGEGGE